MANKEASNHAYGLFRADGYTGSVDDFNALMSTNTEAFDHAYSLFQHDGYKGGLHDFKDLIKGEISHVSVDQLQDYNFFTAERDIT